LKDLTDETEFNHVSKCRTHVFNRVYTGLQCKGPVHPYTIGIIDDEQMKTDRWDSYAQAVNALNRKMGGTKDVLKPKRESLLVI
jgi:hypothetical protein